MKQVQKREYKSCVRVFISNEEYKQEIAYLCMKMGFTKKLPLRGSVFVLQSMTSQINYNVPWPFLTCFIKRLRT